jgi:hypothetical protein
VPSSISFFSMKFPFSWLIGPTLKRVLDQRPLSRRRSYRVAGRDDAPRRSMSRGACAESPGRSSIRRIFVKSDSVLIHATISYNWTRDFMEVRKTLMARTLSLKQAEMRSGTYRKRAIDANPCSQN